MGRVRRQKKLVRDRKRKATRYGKLAAKWKRLWRKAKAKLRKLRDSRKDQVAPHFTIQEFACKDGTPAPAQNRRAIERLARQILEPMRDKFGPCTIHSGYRHARYNAGIGGATASYHIYDLRPSCAAADVTFAKGSPSKWATEARKLGAGGVGTYATFVHLDNGPRRDWRG